MFLEQVVGAPKHSCFGSDRNFRDFLTQNLAKNCLEVSKILRGDCCRTFESF